MLNPIRVPLRALAKNLAFYTMINKRLSIWLLLLLTLAWPLLGRSH